MSRRRHHGRRNRSGNGGNRRKGKGLGILVNRRRPESSWIPLYDIWLNAKERAYSWLYGVPEGSYIRWNSKGKIIGHTTKAKRPWFSKKIGLSKKDEQKGENKMARWKRRSGKGNRKHSHKTMCWYCRRPISGKVAYWSSHPVHKRCYKICCKQLITGKNLLKKYQSSPKRGFWARLFGG